MTVLLVLLAAAVLPVRAMAQEDDPGGEVALAGGRMVQGTVTAVAPGRMTVKTEAGETYQVVVSANTRLSKGDQPVKMTEIKVGDGVGAMGVLDAPAKAVHAIFVGMMDAAQVKKAREDLGKAYIVGKVTAIDMDALKLTVMRPDRVTQVIGVDEGTSFKRGGRGMAVLLSGGSDTGGGSASGGAARAGAGGPAEGESITLADVKVGDSIAGRGAVKNGLFVPSELNVRDAAARRQRRLRGEANGAAAQTAAPGSPQ